MSVPSYGERIESFAVMLLSIDVPAQYAIHVACGMMDQLHRRCWDTNNDLLGQAADVDAATGWTGKEEVIADMMQRAGLIGRMSGEYFLPTALRSAPQTVRRRWERGEKNGEARFINLMERARRAVDVPRQSEERPEEFTPPTSDLDTDLFGQALAPPKETVDDEATTGFQAIIAYWFERYEEKYARKYVFRAKDGKNLKALLKSVGFDALKSAIDRYLLCKDPFYGGHEIDWLNSRINRWTADDKQAGQVSEDRHVERLG